MKKYNKIRKSQFIWFIIFKRIEDKNVIDGSTFRFYRLSNLLYLQKIEA